MTNRAATAHPPDICLILRADGEQRWLISEVVPIVRQLEQPGLIPDDQVGAALAYLEVLWLDACQRAAETDAAREQLDAEGDASAAARQGPRAGTRGTVPLHGAGQLPQCLARHGLHRGGSGERRVRCVHRRDGAVGDRGAGEIRPARAFRRGCAESPYAPRG